MSIVDDNAERIITKVRGGTTNSSTHLCESCEHAFIRRGARPAEDLQMCRKLGYMTELGVGSVIHGKISECNGYYPKGVPCLDDFKELAWELKFDGRRVGFKPPTKKKGEFD